MGRPGIGKMTSTGMADLSPFHRDRRIHSLGFISCLRFPVDRCDFLVRIRVPACNKSEAIQSTVRHEPTCLGSRMPMVGQIQATLSVMSS